MYISEIILTHYQEGINMKNIKLVALDLDGTLFNKESRISKRNLETIKKATKLGITVVISTGRPLNGLPFDQIKGSGIRYAITANGSAIYEIETGKCLREEAMDEDLFVPIVEYLLTKDIHMDAFIGGNGYSPMQCVKNGERLVVPEALKHYILNTRKRVDDLPQFIRDNHLKVQKMTLNFYPDENGVFKDRAEVKNYLESNPNVTSVCGGYNNLEFTRADVNKGVALRALAKILSIDPAETMAIGDTENDLAIIKAAGIGVAMGNATPAVKDQADYVTDDNESDGVATAMEHFIPALRS